MTELKIVPFQHAVVRDLAWVMFSPGLMKSATDDDRLVTDEWCQQTYVEHVGKLYDLDKDPQPLLNYLSHLKSHRLGFYFEALLAFWFEHILLPVRFQKNVPVFRKLKKTGQQTLGEFDFLFSQRHQSLLQHWEVTVKYYLYQKNTAGNVQWIGPAGKDRLDIKLTRIFDHQLGLSETPEGHAVVSSFGFPGVHAAAFIKGYLFYPVDGEEGSLAEALPVTPHFLPELSSSHLKGWWLRHGKADRPKRFSDSKWLLLPKLHWLSAAWCTNPSDELLDDDDMTHFCERHFENRQSSLLLAEMQPGSDGWNEVSRGFVVSHSWPHIPGHNVRPGVRG